MKDQPQTVGQEMMKKRFDDFYESIQLTEEEIQAAILEGKKRKYFHEKHGKDWEEKEKLKP